MKSKTLFFYVCSFLVHHGSSSTISCEDDLFEADARPDNNIEVVLVVRVGHQGLQSLQLWSIHSPAPLQLVLTLDKILCAAKSISRDDLNFTSLAIVISSGLSLIHSVNVMEYSCYFKVKLSMSMSRGGKFVANDLSTSTLKPRSSA